MPAYKIPYPKEIIQCLNGEEPSGVLIRPNLWYEAVYGRTAESIDAEMLVWEWNPFTNTTKMVPFGGYHFYRRGMITRQGHWIWLQAFAGDGHLPSQYIMPIIDLGFDPPRIVV